MFLGRVFLGGGPEILADFVRGGYHLGGVPFLRGGWGINPSANYAETASLKRSSQFVSL